MGDSDAKARAANVKAVMFDVDGVLTDGGIIIDPSGKELKRFDVQDGTGIKFLQRAGFIVAFISGRESKAVEARARELGVGYVYQGCRDKAKAYEDFKRVCSLEDRHVAYVGDDLPDMPAMSRSGLAAAVANARTEVKAAAQYVTQASGGHAAAREFAEWLLKAAGRWEAVVAQYAGGSGERRDQT